MTLQRRLLLLMLASLGVAALTGILAVLGGSGEILGRLALSGLWFGIGLAFAAAAARWISREEYQRSAAISLGATSVSVLCALIATWADLILMSSTLIGRFAGTSALVIFAGQAIAIMHAMERRPTVRIAMRTAIIVAMLGSVPMLGLIWIPSLGWQYENRLAGMAFSTWLTMVPLAACLAGFPALHRHWRWIGVAAVLVGWALGMVGIWRERSDSPWIIVQCGIIATLVSLCNVCQFPTLPGGWSRLRLVSVCCAFAAAGCFTWINVSEWIKDPRGGIDRVGPESVEVRIGAAFGILAVAGMVSLFIVDRLHRRPNGVRVRQIAGIAAVHCTCPRCQKEQSAPLGASRCVGCGIVLTVGVSEPRCPQCDYALADILTDVCPECGTALPRPGEVMKTLTQAPV
ncbi:MAG: hypothetical protein SFY96_03750 [Planctomycetota bacterium]|nr:hypothetical protein [Planctomycetota bacterium]